MSLEETEQLLQECHITPNRLLGQNFMVEPSFYPKLSSYAGLQDSDVVLDAGAGLGFLSRFLAGKCKQVLAVEKDPQVAKALREQVTAYSKIIVLEGDVLKMEMPPFNKVIAIPPYYLSSQLIVWLFERKVECSILILQKEFANRLVAPVGSDNYGWLTVISYLHGEVTLLDNVSKENFFPQPEVDSIIIAIKPWIQKAFEVKDSQFFMQMVKSLFTERNKKIGKAILPFLRSNLGLNKHEAVQLAIKLPFIERRARELSPEEFGEIANAIS